MKAPNRGDLRVLQLQPKARAGHVGIDSGTKRNRNGNVVPRFNLDLNRDRLGADGECQLPLLFDSARSDDHGCCADRVVRARSPARPARSVPSSARPVGPSRGEAAWNGCPPSGSGLRAAREARARGSSPTTFATAMSARARSRKSMDCRDMRFDPTSRVCGRRLAPPPRTGRPGAALCAHGRPPAGDLAFTADSARWPRTRLIARRYRSGRFVIRPGRPRRHRRVRMTHKELRHWHVEAGTIWCRCQQEATNG